MLMPPAPEQRKRLAEQAVYVCNGHMCVTPGFLLSHGLGTGTTCLFVCVCVCVVKYFFYILHQNVSPEVARTEVAVDVDTINEETVGTSLKAYILRALALVCF